MVDQLNYVDDPFHHHTGGVNALQSSSIFELIRTLELFGNKTMVRWSKTFPYNVGVSQILVLSKLRENGAMKQSELAHELGYTPGALTNIADRLMKESYVERVYDETDRRIIRLSITEKGKTILDQAQKTGQKMRKDIFSILTEEEIQQYLAIQQKLLNHLDEQ